MVKLRYEPAKNLRYNHRCINMMFHSFAGILPENELVIVIMMNSHNDYAITQTINLMLKNYSKK